MILPQIAASIAREEQEFAKRTPRQINALAALARGFEVLDPDDDSSADSLFVRRPDGTVICFDPMNQLADAMRLAAHCRARIEYKSDGISDGYLRKELFSAHQGNIVKTTCVFATKRAAVRILNRGKSALVEEPVCDSNAITTNQLNALSVGQG